MPLFVHLRLHRVFSLLLFAGAAAVRAAVPEGTEALLVIVGDQHSAYERTAQLVARIDRLRAENPGLPLAILIDGDSFELGNVVARRSGGAIEFAMFAALAQRAPTLLNLGNHEPEFFDLAETVARVQATGVTVIGNITDRTTSRPYAAASTKLKLGEREAVVVGLTTDHLSTFRVAVRPSLDLADPVVWAKKNLPGLLAAAPVKIVLSHAGLAADRSILPLVPDGTLFAGAHDHVRFVHREGRSVYVHSGAWNEFLTLAALRTDATGANWSVQQVRIAEDDPADPALAAFIRETQAKQLTAEDTAVVGRSLRALSPDEAARFVVAAVRNAAGVDAAFVGHTTFGAGLPAGEVNRVALDACVRFDGSIYVGEISGARLSVLMSEANEGPDTPFARRHGDFLVAVGPDRIDPEKNYRIATADWVARNAKNYLGADDVALRENPNLRLKAIAAAALAHDK